MSSPARQVEAASSGAAIIGGGVRLSPAEETALNLLLKKAGGEEDGIQLYKLGWAMEDNQTTLDRKTGEYKYDSKKVPVCVGNQASYHLLSWAPPTQTDMELEHHFKGEDFSKGTYTCIMHFEDVDGKPFNPTASLVERIIPVLQDMNQIATATRKGFTAERNQLRTKKIAEWKQREAEAGKKYESDAEAILGEGVAAFEGNPTSFPGAKGKSTADIVGPEEYRASLALRNNVSHVGSQHAVVQPREAPVNFAFSAHSKKPKTKE